VPKILIVGLLVVVAANVAELGYERLTSASSPDPSNWFSSSIDPPPFDDDVPSDRPRGALGEADGAVPDSTTVFDDGIPGVAKLDPALLAAVRQAATDAADEGVVFFVDSGWRSRDYQEHLLDEAVSEYGSEAEAARWVATPETSAHVSGHAIDIGRSDATDWLAEHGAGYGLCQIYGNEPWHFELHPDAAAVGCPPMYADPTEDPRMSA
jgi:hypothetical protein